MRTILVTGGAGFIAANLVNYLSEKYPEDRIIVLDILTTYATPRWWICWSRRRKSSSISPPRPTSPVRWTNDQSTGCDYESVGGVNSLVTRSILR